jgi:hypothetical protein
MVSDGYIEAASLPALIASVIRLFQADAIGLDRRITEARHCGFSGSSSGSVDAGRSAWA